MRCQSHTKDGRPCGAPAQHNSGYCYTHDPALAEPRDAARKRGGAARRDQLRGVKMPCLKSAEDVRGYLDRVMADTARQLIPAGAARAIANLARVQLEVIADIETQATLARDENERRERRRY